MTTCVALLENIKTPKITNIQFGLLNPAVVSRQSVVHVTKPTLYIRQLPAPGGLNDLRMGTSDRRLPCGTCKNDVLNCVGHPGHIELAAPVYHVSMITIVLKILRCVCFFCSRLLVDYEKEARVQDERFKSADPKDRLALMVNMCKAKHVCLHCHGYQPKYTQIRTLTQIKTEFRPKDLEKVETEEERVFVSLPFTAATARSILEFIPDHEVRILGINPEFARPEWMILTVIQVPPPISRPSIMATDGSRARGQDDITLKLQDIVKANNTLARILIQTQTQTSSSSSSSLPVPPPTACFFLTKAPSAEVKTAWDVLQNHLVQFMHHDAAAAAGAGSSNAPRRNTRPLRLIPSRLKGKKGRFRGTLGGKRVDYSARTVVSPAPTYDIHEVGVPQIIAQQLTYPERVNLLNIHDLTRRVRNGPLHPEGAAAVIHSDGTLIDLTLYKTASTTITDPLLLQPGWVVERYLRDGDWVLFNRQPSLHRMSIMAHQIRVTQDKTFRLPVCDTTPYNADFDGDEMNLHVLRTVEAVAEAKELMCVSTQIISPQSNKPIIGLVQDSLVSAFLLTHKDTFFERDVFMQMVMPIKYVLFTDLPRPAVLKPRPLWTGKQLMSLLLPRFSLSTVVRSGNADGVHLDKEGAMDVYERAVVIRDGLLCAGALCKKTLGTSANGIIHVLVKDFGNNVAAQFISDAQRVLVEFMLCRGFSVGIGDCMMNAELHSNVNDSINRCLTYGDTIIRSAEQGDIPISLLEGCMTKLMTGVLNRAGAVVQQDLPENNNVFTMVQSGAKGSSVNIAQILGCVGQQSVEGGRISCDTDKRTLPCYRRGESTADSRGFVANSYGTGLTAQEYFFHAMGGREGLVDTAVKTASTGYIQRRLIKAEEGLQVRYDNSVRNTKDHIVQFYYGGDSFDPVFIEKQSLRTFSMSNKELHDEYTFSEDMLTGALATHTIPCAWSEWERAQSVEVRQLREDRDVVRTSRLQLHHAPDATIFVTICARRLLETTRTRFGIHRRSLSDLCTPGDVSRHVLRAIKMIQNMRRETATRVTLAYIRSIFCLKHVVIEQRLTREALEWCMGELVDRYRRSLVPAGEMVGTLGAASIGEPCTQMTLNTFHTAGVAEKTVTLGVPRLKELIDTSRNIKTPSTAIYFEPPYCTSENMSMRFGVGLQYTLLNHVVETSTVELDPLFWHTSIDADKVIVDAYRELFASDDDEKVESEGVTRWVIRFVLDRHNLALRHMTVQHVADALQSYMGDCAQIMCSEVNMLQWCVRLRVRHNSILTEDLSSLTTDKEELEALEYESVKTIHDFLIDNMPVTGVPGIDRVMVHTQQRLRVEDSDADQRLESTKEWMADTEGTNLAALLSLPYIDKTRTISNDIHEVLALLGIEAAQQVLMDEIRAVLSFDGAYVNERHLQLLVDVMTLSGTLTAMTRHSMHKLGGSTYHHASFEETQDVLINAAAFGTSDRICGVTDNLMIGMLMPGGTGCCDIIDDDSRTRAHHAQKTIVKPMTFPSAPACIVRPLVRDLVRECPVPVVVKPLKGLVETRVKTLVKTLAETRVETRVKTQFKRARVSDDDDGNKGPRHKHKRNKDKEEEESSSSLDAASLDSDSDSDSDSDETETAVAETTVATVATVATETTEATDTASRPKSKPVLKPLPMFIPLSPKNTLYRKAFKPLSPQFIPNQ